MKLAALLVFLCFNFTNAQSEFSMNVGEIKQERYYHTFDFENVKGKIIIDVSINNQIRKFILDTGAPTSITESLLSETDFEVIQKIPVVDANGKSSENKIVAIPEFSINGLIFENTHALSIPNTELFECFQVDGIVGSNSLRNSVVEFDFQNKKITITNHLKNFGYKGLKTNKLYFKDIQSSPILKVKMQLGYITLNEEVMFDSGDDSFYSISNQNYEHIMKKIKDKQFPEELHDINHLDLLGIVASSNGSFSVSLNGNAEENLNHKFKIQSFMFDHTTFNNIISTTTYGNSSRIGSEILQYGKLILDYKRKRYYFQAYENTSEIDINHKFKSFYPTFENEKFIIGIVWDEKFKDKIKSGDEILKINGIDFSTLSKCEIMLMSFDDFNTNSTLVVTLKDSKTAEIKVIEVEQ